MFGKEDKTEAFERILIRESGMRGSWEYEIINKGSEAEITFYRIYYADGNDERRAEEKASCDINTFNDILRKHGVLKWNGFHGKHPKHVRDGIMFRFTAELSDGTTIKADGSENFPKGYREFTGWINDTLKG